MTLLIVLLLAVISGLTYWKMPKGIEIEKCYFRNDSFTHCVVGEITVTYEKVSVTYRLTYDQDMRLSGLYVR